MFKNKDYVYMVYKEQSFSKAAEKFCISQPSLSITIKKAEQEAGKKIFDRKSHSLTLTPFGVEYIRSIEKIYDIEHHMHSISSDLNNLQLGSLSIGGSSLSIPYIIPKIVCSFKKCYPKIELKISEKSTVKSKLLLDDGTMDLIITNRPLDLNIYERIFLYHEHLVVAVPREFDINHRLQGLQLTIKDLKKGITNLGPDKEVSIINFADVPFIFLHKKNYLRFCTDLLFESEKILPKTILEVNDTDIAFNFAHYGLGAAIFNDTRISTEMEHPTLCFYKIHGKLAARDAYIYFRKNGLQTVAMKKFIEMAVEMCKV